MKNRKRLIIISSFLIMLCALEFVVGYYCNSRANSHVIYNNAQTVITETDTIEQISTEAETEEVSSEGEENATEAETQTIKKVKEPEAEKEEPVNEPIRAPYIGPGYCITCWGDSLTEGTGSWTITMPSTLGNLTNIKTYNMGVFGEDSRAIAGRQGGLKMYVNNITIPASGSVRFGQIMCDNTPIYLWEDPYNRRNPYGLTACFDSCSIGGISGKLTYDYDTDEYVFTRAEDEKPSETVTEAEPETEPVTESVTEPVTKSLVEETTTKESTKATVAAKPKNVSTGLRISSPTEIKMPASEERKNDILILEMGNNGGYEGDYSILVKQYQTMIDYSGNGFYIIVGDTDYAKSVREDWETALQDAFGDHFFNMRQYLVDFAAKGGLNQYGITLNEDDLDCIAVGEVPYCLKIEDGSHLNSIGYTIEGNAIYQKGLELGYWVE